MAEEVFELEFRDGRPVYTCALCGEEFTSDRRHKAYATLGARAQVVRHVAQDHPEHDSPDLRTFSDRDLPAQ